MKAALLQKPQRFRMKSLASMAGISKETIHFYMQSGLLPKPAKSSHNMAWYDQRHLDRIVLIKELQEKHFLPLRAIKAIVNNERGYVFSERQQETIAGIREKLQEKTEAVHGEVLPLADLMRDVQFSTAEIGKLASLGWISVVGKGADAKISKPDADFVRKWGKVRDLGLTPKRGFSEKDFDMFEHCFAALVNEEVRFLVERLSSLEPDKAWRIFENLCPVLNEVLAELHKRKLFSALAEYVAPQAEPVLPA